MADSPSKRSQGLRPETLLSSLALVLIVNLLQRSVGFGRAVLFCRWLDAEQLGYWEMAIGFLMLASPLVVLGLPGSFGRYLEKHRTQGRLQLFLRRTTLWTFGIAAAALGVLAWKVDWLAALVFGDATQMQLTVTVLVCLAIVVAHHFLEAVFAGLRLYRVVSTMHFVQSMAFAVVSLSLLAWWQVGALSLVAGYGAACALSVGGVLLWSLWRVDATPDAAPPMRHAEFWPPLVQFAVWIWVTNLLTNVFSIIDRYMILHFGGFSNEVALEQVGNYHTSMIVPILLISIANLMVGAMTPHLSHEWEEGHHQSVGRKINLGLKIASLALLVAGVGVLLLCPLLFEVAFGNKYAEGLAVLPWTLAGCVWFSLLLVAQTYVWCAEKSHRACLPLAIGLVLNVLLNLALLPVWGLLGAVMATGIATMVTYYGQLLVNHRLGMEVSRGMLLAGVLPLLLTLGPTGATAGTLLVLLMAATRSWVMSDQERHEVMQVVRQRIGRFLPNVFPSSRKPA